MARLVAPSRPVRGRSSSRTNASGANPLKPALRGGDFFTTPRMGSSSAPSFTLSPTLALN